MLLRSLLLVIVAFSGFAAPWTSAPRHPALTTTTLRADTQLLGLASRRLADHSRLEVVRWLDRHSRVRSAGVGQDGQTIDMRFRDGLEMAILPALRRSASIPRSQSKTVPLRPLAQPNGPEQRALVLEPFASDELGTHDADPELKVLQANGFQVDYLSDGAVNVDEMASLWKYNVVYMHTHGGVNQWGYAVVATGQPADNDPSMLPLLQSGMIMITGVSGLTTKYYGILGPYIDNYASRFPSNSLLYIDTCDILSADKFWNSLASKGVGAFVSWDGHSIFQDETRAAQTFFGYMGQGMTVAEALNAVHNDRYDTSNFDGKVTHLGYLGDGYITLHGRSPTAPTNTPVLPTSTPLPTATATSSPTSTPTPTPAPPLTVNVKPSVKPGTQQLISVTSSPSVPVHFEVDFPNGDMLDRSTRTDTAGQARYTYVQRSSMILHNLRVARVTVTAGTNGATSNATATYRIGFGVIDASVEPRIQAAGGTVRVWVHAMPNNPILVSLRLAGKEILRIAGRTGPRGWLHRRYTISPSLGSGRTVTVVARAESGDRLSRTSTTFQVR